MRRIAERLLWLAVGCLFLMSCVLSTSSTTVKGRVRDGSGRPIAGAEVKLGGPLNQATATTAEDGSFTVTAQHRYLQVLTLTVSKPGFAPHEERFPGFAAPDAEHIVELKRVILPSR